MNGFVFRTNWHGIGSPCFEMLANRMPRNHALTIALEAMGSAQWFGPKQALFIRDDGSIEIWNPTTRFDEWIPNHQT